MKRICLLTLPLALMALAGCDSKPAEGVPSESETVKLVELSAIKGGTPCCPVPRKKAEK